MAMASFPPFQTWIELQINQGVVAWFLGNRLRHLTFLGH